MECPPRDHDMKYLTSMNLYKNLKTEKPCSLWFWSFFWPLILFLFLINWWSAPLARCTFDIWVGNGQSKTQASSHAVLLWLRLLTRVIELMWWQTEIFLLICKVLLHGTKWNKMHVIFRGMGQLGPPLMGTTMSMMMAGVMFFNIIISSTVDAAAMMTAPQRLESSWKS